MKIQKDRLKQIIKEELAVGSVEMSHGSGDYPVDQHGYEGSMAKTNLMKIAEYAENLMHMIHDDEDLEPWVEEKIAVAAYMMDSVGHHMQYEKMQGGEGEHEIPDEGEYLEIHAGGDEEEQDDAAYEDEDADEETEFEGDEE